MLCFVTIMVDFFVEHLGELHVFLVLEFLLQFHNQIFDGVRVWDIFEKKFFLFGGRLDFQIAIIEKSGDDTFDVRGHVLDLFQAELAGSPGKEPILLNVHDALICHNPNVEIVIDPDDEKGDPGENEKQIAHKSNQFLEGGTFEIAEKNRRQPV